MREEHYLFYKFYRKKTIEEIDKKIKLLGTSTKLDVYKFFYIRTFGSIILFIIIFFSQSLGFILAPLVTLIYYYAIAYILLDQKIKKRKTSLEIDALNFFEILTLSLETGRNLTEAIKVTLSSSTSSLADEFREALREVNYGKSLTDALMEMQDNIPSEAINNMILSLTQANLYGSSIIKSLYNQLDYLREKRKLEVKAEISKVPIKISIISVFFFVPLILLIILAPVLLNYIN